MGAEENSGDPIHYKCDMDESDELKKKARRERQREKIIQEILKTEETYQTHIDLIVKVFEEPLRARGLIPDHVVFTIFSNIRQIINVNKELYQHLQHMPIGRAFLQMGPFLKLYSTYANNHERALATLLEWDQKSAEFSTFRRSQEELPEMHGLKLNALLITPVQRIPRYKLLLQDLLDHTESDHSDYNSIQEACGHIGAVATHINNHIKQQDNSIRMLSIQKSLVGPLAPRLITPGRIFIKEGPLKKVSKKGGRSHERMFFLFSDILMYAKPRLQIDSGFSGSGYLCCCIMPLQHCKVSRVLGQHGHGQASLFSIKCKNESLLLYSDQKTVDSWITALIKAVGEFVENRQSLRKESSAKMPVRKGALLKYRKQQELADPLNAARSPTLAKSKKSDRGFTRASKEGGAFSARQSMWDRARENVRRLTPRRRRKNVNSTRQQVMNKIEIVHTSHDASLALRDIPELQMADDSVGIEQQHDWRTADTTVGEPNQHLRVADETLGLEQSHVWRIADDTTISEHQSPKVAGPVHFPVLQLAVQSPSHITLQTHDHSKTSTPVHHHSDTKNLSHPLGNTSTPVQDFSRNDVDLNGSFSNPNSEDIITNDNANNSEFVLNIKGCTVTSSNTDEMEELNLNTAENLSLPKFDRERSSKSTSLVYNPMSGHGDVSGTAVNCINEQRRDRNRNALTVVKISDCTISSSTDSGFASNFASDSHSINAENENSTLTLRVSSSLANLSNRETEHSATLSEFSQDKERENFTDAPDFAGGIPAGTFPQYSSVEISTGASSQECRTPSVVSDGGSTTSMSTSMGDLDELSLREISKHYSFLLDNQEHDGENEDDDNSLKDKTVDHMVSNDVTRSVTSMKQYENEPYSWLRHNQLCREPLRQLGENRNEPLRQLGKNPGGSTPSSQEMKHGSGWDSSRIARKSPRATFGDSIDLNTPRRKRSRMESTDRSFEKSVDETDNEAVFSWATALTASNPARLFYSPGPQSSSYASGCIVQ